MLVLLLLLEAQTPSQPSPRLAADASPFSLAVDEPTLVTEAKDGDTAVVVARVVLTNDTPSRIRITNPLWDIAGAHPELRLSGCSIATDDPKPRTLETSVSLGTQHGAPYLLFRHADLTLAPKESATLVATCDVLPGTDDATLSLSFAQAQLYAAGPQGAGRLAKRHVAAPTQSVAIRHADVPPPTAVAAH